MNLTNTDLDHILQINPHTNQGTRIALRNAFRLGHKIGALHAREEIQRLNKKLHKLNNERPQP
jgi:flagellar biosynthesis/type III secretory pathway protein FliH